LEGARLGLAAHANARHRRLQALAAVLAACLRALAARPDVTAF
jgi:hypothetical protein